MWEKALEENLSRCLDDYRDTERERAVRGGVGGVCTLTASEWKESSGSDATGISACLTFVSSGINTRDLFISNVEMVASSHSGDEC